MNKNIAYKALNIAFELFIKILFVFLFMKVPHMLFVKFMDAQAVGFGLENCFVYFGLVLCGICGSIVRSEVFSDVHPDDVRNITAKYEAKQYFRKKLMNRWIMDFCGFWLAFSVWGMNVFKAFYLALVILFSRFAGEMINILIFRVTGKSFVDIRGANVFVMLGALICAYFLPFIRGYVPAAYDFVFSTVWLPVILVSGSIFLYYVWNYKSYAKILKTLNSNSENETDGFTLKESFEEKNEISDETADKIIKKGSDYEVFSQLFINRNYKLMLGGIITRVLIITGVLVVAIIAASMGHNDIVYKVISYSMPLIAFIMYAMSRGRITCKEIYNDCDSYLIHRGYFKNKEKLFNNYLMRLGLVTFIDIIPAIYLAFAYMIAGILAGREDSASTIAAVCVGIIVLSILFSNYNVFMYYICMPFSKDRTDTKGRIVYNFINIFMYVLCYACIFIQTTSLFFTLVAALVMAVTLSVTATIVAGIAIRNFRINN